MTYSDVWQYQLEVLRTITEASEDRRDNVRLRAKQLLPAAVENLISQGTLDQAVAVLEDVANRVHDGDLEFDAHDVAEALRRGRKNLEQIIQNQPDSVPYVGRLNHAQERLRAAPYSVRLRVLVGGWSILDEEGDPELSSLERQSRRIEELAQEACTEPSPLDDSSVEWLLSEQARRAHEFWTSLGRHDIARRWAGRVGELAQEDRATNALRGYLFGWRRQDADGASTFFRNLIASGRIAATAIVECALIAEDPDAGATRIGGLLATNKVEPQMVARVIESASWLERVSEERLQHVLTQIVGPSFERAGLIVELTEFIFHIRVRVEPSLADFIWHCLEARPKLSSYNDEYYCDVVAARLTRLDTERGFALLDRVLRAPYESRAWQPLWGAPQHIFWDALSEIDRSRAVLVILEAALAGQSALGGDILGEVVDAETDHNVLLEFADRGEQEAGLVAGTLAYRKQGFWRAAFALVERYRSSQRVLDGLNWGLRALGGTIVGPMSSHLQRCRAEATRALVEEAPPPVAREWLEERIAALDKQIETERRREADEQVNW